MTTPPFWAESLDSESQGTEGSEVEELDTEPRATEGEPPHDLGRMRAGLKKAEESASAWRRGVEETSAAQLGPSTKRQRVTDGHASAAPWSAFTLLSERTSGE